MTGFSWITFLGVRSGKAGQGIIGTASFLISNITHGNGKIWRELVSDHQDFRVMKFNASAF
jgi:hypothetical protein